MCHCSSNSASSSSASLTTSLTRILLLAQLVAELEDLLDRDRRVEHDLQHAPLAVLDALGDLDLALAREQRDRAHLAQVHAHRVVGLASSRRPPLPPRPRPSCLVLLVLARRGPWAASPISGDLRLRRRRRSRCPRSPSADSQSSIWSDETMSSGMCVVDLVVGQEALLLAELDQLVLARSSPRSRCRRRGPSCRCGSRPRARPHRPRSTRLRRGASPRSSSSSSSRSAIGDATSSSMSTRSSGRGPLAAFAPGLPRPCAFAARGEVVVLVVVAVAEAVVRRRAAAAPTLGALRGRLGAACGSRLGCLGRLTAGAPSFLAFSSFAGAAALAVAFAGAFPLSLGCRRPWPAPWLPGFVLLGVFAIFTLPAFGWTQILSAMSCSTSSRSPLRCARPIAPADERDRDSAAALVLRPAASRDPLLRDHRLRAARGHQPSARAARSDPWPRRTFRTARA